MFWVAKYEGYNCWDSAVTIKFVLQILFSHGWNCNFVGELFVFNLCWRLQIGNNILNSHYACSLMATISVMLLNDRLTGTLFVHTGWKTDVSYSRWLLQLYCELWYIVKNKPVIAFVLWLRRLERWHRACVERIVIGSSPNLYPILLSARLTCYSFSSFSYSVLSAHGEWQNKKRALVILYRTHKLLWYKPFKANSDECKIIIKLKLHKN